MREDHELLNDETIQALEELSMISGILTLL
jgi:hypothetical protein